MNKFNILIFLMQCKNFIYKIFAKIKQLKKILLLKLSKDEVHLIFGNEYSTDTYAEILNSKAYSEYRKKLFKNLDSKSKNIVKTILKRIHLVINKKQKYFLLSFSEIIKLQKAKIEKKTAIKSTDNYYSYFDYKLPREHFNSGIFYDKYFINDFKTLNKIRNADIIDVGGFIGDSAIVFEKFTNKKVHVFEPVTQNYNDLLKTIRLNNSQSIIPYKLGLGKTLETLSINIFEKSGVASTIRKDRELEKSNTKENIQIDKLDSIIEKYNINPGLIKVDVEGAEQDFLAGAINTIKQYKPALILSIYHTGSDFFKLKTIIEDLNLNYSFKIRKASKCKIFDDTILLCEVNEDA